MGLNTDFVLTMILAVVVVGLVMGGPLTLYALVKLVNHLFGSPKTRFVKLASSETPLGILVTWDSESFEWEICRVRVDFYELVKGGRSSSFSFTFEDKGAKKKSFLIPMKLNQSDYAMLSDNGLTGAPRAVARSYVNIEIETVNGLTERKKVSKNEILEVLKGPQFVAPKEIDVLQPMVSDPWSVLTRVFPWRKVATATATAAAPAKEEAGKAAAPKEPKAVAAVDFIVTKVWIEPGCIVCDACENEAPQVFQVLPDTCIVRENAPLTDGASIKAAAEGCPVNVIKYTTTPK